MFDIGQKVVVITGNAIPFYGVILARAKGDNGPGAYKIALNDNDPEDPGEWHKACNVFVIDPPAPPQDEPIQINQVRNFLRQ